MLSCASGSVYAQSAPSENLLASYFGEVCAETLAVPAADRISVIVLRRVGSATNLNYRNVDWVRVNTQNNPQIANPDDVPAGSQLKLLTPKIQGVPVRSKAVCYTNRPTATATGSTSSSSGSSSTASKEPNVDADSAMKAYTAYSQGQVRQSNEIHAQTLERPSLASNAGIRYGSPMINDAVLLPKSRMVNAFVQIKGGSLDGLTLFSDFVPEVKENFEGQDFALAWNRITLGWGFGKEFPAIHGRVDFAPRIGFWTVEATLPRKQADGSLGANDFAFRRPSMGLEAGLGFDIYKSTSVRMWTARDVARALGDDQTAGASSQREGLDFYIPGPDFSVGSSPMRCVFVTYLMHDAVFFTTEQPDSDALLKGVKDTENPNETYYGLLYAGLGATLTF